MKDKCECIWQDHEYGDTYVTEHIKCQNCYDKEVEEYESRFEDKLAKSLLVQLLQVKPNVKVVRDDVYEECLYCHGKNKYRATNYKLKHYHNCPYAIGLNIMLGDGWDERRPLIAEEVKYEPYIPDLDEDGNEIIPF